MVGPFTLLSLTSLGSGNHYSILYFCEINALDSTVKTDWYFSFCGISQMQEHK
jgi:hypothetical protein